MRSRVIKTRGSKSLTSQVPRWTPSLFFANPVAFSSHRGILPQMGRNLYDAVCPLHSSGRVVFTVLLFPPSLLRFIAEQHSPVSWYLFHRHFSISRHLSLFPPINFPPKLYVRKIKSRHFPAHLWADFRIETCSITIHNATTPQSQFENIEGSTFSMGVSGWKEHY